MNNEYTELFDKIEEITTKQKNQKLRGLNDYNLLTTVLNLHDEVRLHSRMIASLLNPNAKHYQGILFLEHFIQTLGLENFGLNLQGTNVYVEYKDIDIYITDGTKHIVLENKIWAGDQPCQIIKYINIIQNEYNLNFAPGLHSWEGSKLDILENIKVVYLTPTNKPCPSQHIVNNDHISFDGAKQELDDCSNRMKSTKTIDFDMKNYQASFLKIDYENEILFWLNNSRDEVRNITNLNEAIGQYIDVVKMVNNNYEGNVMTINDELRASVDQGYLKTALKLDKEMKEVKGKILEDLFIKVKEVFITTGPYDDVAENIIPDARVYDKIKCRKFFDKKANVFGIFIDCGFGKDRYLYLCALYSDLYYGIVQCDQNGIVPMTKNTNFDGLLKHIKWKEITWYANANYGNVDLDMIKIFDLLEDFENSTLKDEMFTMIENVNKYK